MLQELIGSRKKLTTTMSSVFRRVEKQIFWGFSYPAIPTGGMDGIQLGLALGSFL